MSDRLSSGDKFIFSTACIIYICTFSPVLGLIAVGLSWVLDRWEREST